MTVNAPRPALPRRPTSTEAQARYRVSLAGGWSPSAPPTCPSPWPRRERSPWAGARCGCGTRPSTASRLPPATTACRSTAPPPSTPPGSRAAEPSWPITAEPPTKVASIPTHGIIEPLVVAPRTTGPPHRGRAPAPRRRRQGRAGHRAVHLLGDQLPADRPGEHLAQAGRTHQRRRGGRGGWSGCSSAGATAGSRGARSRRTRRPRRRGVST